MTHKHSFAVLICLLAVCSKMLAQGDISTKDCKPEFRRQLNHDYIDREQKSILASDGKADNFFNISSNEEVNFLVNQALVNRVDWLQCNIEKDSALDHRLKVQYLRGLENLLKYFNENWRPGYVNPSTLPEILEAYESCIKKDRAGLSIKDIINSLSYEVGTAVLRANIFDKNPGYTASSNLLILKYCTTHPDQVFQILKRNPDVPFLDSLVKVNGYKYPRQLYEYTAANNKLSYAIRKINDPLVRAISRMATSGGSGQLYFPFLDNIVKGYMTFDDIDVAKRDSIKYFQLLVKTQLDYVARAVNKDTAIEFDAMDKMLERKAQDLFVNTINGLHEETDAVRFKIIQSLSAQELYYVAVLSDGIIYTSSYTHGVYPLMMSKIGQRGDSLLMSVKFDKYRKFIKMAAGYNTLSNFFSTFPNKNDVTSLMTAFVNGLEKSGSLEDGVDVADSYTSISESDTLTAQFMLGLCKKSYEKNVSQNNKRGTVMYNLLYKLFLSADTTNNIDLSKEFGIPPVYSVSYKSLANDSGQVIMQVFFYGDQDGQNIFQGFLKQFNNSNWKVTPSEQWVLLSSTRGKPIRIYANRPLPEDGGEDEKAQTALDEYLAKQNLQPTIVIHRGHSYYAKYTIEQILPSAKIVFMGSCGGYHLIHDIFKHSPDAHIIASKQIGKTRINQPFFNLLMEKLRTGQNIDWIPFWKELNKNVTVEGFEDYIPPHKNLGAIFIKAYNTSMGDEQKNL